MHHQSQSKSTFVPSVGEKTAKRPQYVRESIYDSAFRSQEPSRGDTFGFGAYIKDKSILASYTQEFQLQNLALQKRESLRREDLRDVQVIGQLDRKFIMCKIDFQGQCKIIAIDQHAADERLFSVASFIESNWKS
jgi:DNA mismatch repair ATPase MutL